MHSFIPIPSNIVLVEYVDFFPSIWIYPSYKMIFGAILPSSAQAPPPACVQKIIGNIASRHTMMSPIDKIDDFRRQPEK